MGSIDARVREGLWMVAPGKPREGNGPLRQSRLNAAKRAFTTRRVDASLVHGRISDGVPAPGDIVLAAIASVGKHTRLESTQGRRMHLYEGDEIIVAYGNRYAPDQFEAIVPNGLQECDLVAGGGLASHVVSRHSSVGRPTKIKPIGLLTDKHGQVLNLAHFALPERNIDDNRPRVIAVAGTSMNAGKTTAASSLIHGLTKAGLHVTASKATGTGSGLDLWSLQDAGAGFVLDFTDMGHASTAGLAIDRLERTVLSLIAHCTESSPDVIVVELADGLFQRETGALLESTNFRQAIDGIVFASGDAMGAVTGKEWLERRGHRVLALSGQLSASPLASTEAEAATGLSVYTKAQLRDSELAPQLAFSAEMNGSAMVLNAAAVR